jgi:hypothetical protein
MIFPVKTLSAIVLEKGEAAVPDVEPLVNVKSELEYTFGVPAVVALI